MWIAEASLAIFTVVPAPHLAPFSCRLWVPFEAAYALRCQPGSIVLVAIPGADGRPRSLLDGISLNIQVPLLSANDAPGQLFVPAEVWPSAKLRAGTAAMSTALANALACKSQLPMQVALYGNQTGDVFTGTNEVCEEIHLRLCYSEPCKEPAESLGPPQRAPNIQNQHSPLSRSLVTPSGQQKQRQGRAMMSPSMRNSASKDYYSPGLPSQTSKPPTTQERHDGPISPLNVPTSKDQLLAVSEAILAGDHPSARVVDIMEVIVRELLTHRYVLEGSIIDLPLFGVDVKLYVEFTVPESGQRLTRIEAITKIFICSPARSTERKQEEDPAVNFARRAATMTATELGVADIDPASIAAYHAALSGYRSLGSSFTDIGGLEFQMSVLQRSIVGPLLPGTVHHALLPTGVLLYGPPGTGKTALARAAAGSSGASFLIINGPDIVSEHLGDSEACLRGVFAAAERLAPSIVFIDEIDAITPSRDSSSYSAVSGRLVTALLNELDSLAGKKVVVLGATNRRTAIDDSLRRPGRFDRELEIGVPSPKDRMLILTKILDRMLHNLTVPQIGLLGEETHGFVGADLASLCSEAAISALRRRVLDSFSTFSTTWEDFATAKRSVRPSALRELAVDIPKVRWVDIGGNDDLKHQLREVVEWPVRCQSSLDRMGVKPPRGVLLYGPPGCSKTLLAKAVAGESGLNFVAIKGPELLSKYVGESEKALRAVFERARRSSPCIIFFDEIDGLVGTRSPELQSGNVSVSDRVLSQLLQEMDGLQTGVSQTIILAATNRPDFIDKALLRPGRFDRLLYVPPPDANAREAIFQVHLRNIPVANDVDIASLARETEGFTGADIASICQQAAILALEADEFAERVASKHFHAAIVSSQPSLVAAGYAHIYNAYQRSVIG